MADGGSSRGHDVCSRAHDVSISSGSTENKGTTERDTRHEF